MYSLYFFFAEHILKNKSKKKKRVIKRIEKEIPSKEKYIKQNRL